MLGSRQSRVIIIFSNRLFRRGRENTIIIVVVVVIVGTRIVRQRDLIGRVIEASRAVFDMRDDARRLIKSERST